MDCQECGAATPDRHRILFNMFSLFKLHNTYILCNLNLHKYSHRAHVLVTGSGDVPAARASQLPAYLQSDIVPPIREQGRKALPCMDPPAIHEQPGVRVCVRWIGQLNLDNFRSILHMLQLLYHLKF